MRTFDMTKLHHGHQQHDAATLTELYADDAVLEIIDATSPPSSPRVLRGKDEIRAFYEDLCSRDMTHEVIDLVADDRRVAFNVACQYATGERVITSENCELRDGRIAREVLVQAWDG